VSIDNTPPSRGGGQMDRKRKPREDRTYSLSIISSFKLTATKRNERKKERVVAIAIAAFI